MYVVPVVEGVTDVTKRFRRQEGLDQLYWLATVTSKRSLPWHDVVWSIADLRIEFPELSAGSDECSPNKLKL